jgi:hypothetical protein
MGYRDRTYVIFDADSDMWAYGFMKGWHLNEHVDFNFYDAHELNKLTDSAGEDTVKRKLRERMAEARQAIVLVGEHTKNLFRFVRWEIDLAINNALPTVVVNLNGGRDFDRERCPAILRDHYAIHVSYNARIIKYALDNFAPSYAYNRLSQNGPRIYNATTYSGLGL